MTTSLLALKRLIANIDGLGYAYGTCSEAGASTGLTIVDTSGDSPFDTDDSPTDYKNAWAQIEANGAGSTNVGDIRRIKTYTPGNSITVSRAFTAQTTTDMRYGIYMGLPPEDVARRRGIKTYVNDFLRTHRYRYYQLLTLVTDGDMEATGVTNWTANNATLVKVTTAASVTGGKQGLQVSTTAINGYAQSAAVAVAGTGLPFWHAVADVAANTGTAKLQLWDVTNSAEIASVSTTSRAATTLWLTNANIPSTCHTVVVRLIGTGSGNVAVWDNVSLRPSSTWSLALPAWVTKTTQIERVKFSFDRGVALSTGVYARDGREYIDVYDFNIVEDYGAANQYRVVVPEVNLDRHVFVVGLRYFSELTSDTDTTDCDSEWLKASVLAVIFNESGEKGKVGFWASEAKRLNREPVYNPRLFKPLRGI